MFSKMKILFYLSKKRVNQRLQAPIYCRITVDNECCELSTGLFVGLDQFKNGYVLDEHPQACVYNPKLDLMKTRLNSIHLELCLKNEFITPYILKERFCDKPFKQKKFVELLEELVFTAQETANTKSTKFSYEIRQKNILKAVKKNNLQNIYCSQIDGKFLSMIEKQLLVKFNHNYTNKHLFLIGQVLKLAIQRNYINRNEVTFYKKTKDEKKPIVALTKIELIKLQSHKFVSERLQHVADLYVFQCYTGFAYVDMCSFRYDKHVHLIEKKLWIIENRAKTNSEALLPLFQKAALILKKYKNNLPLLTNQKYNAYLKEISDIVGINKNLTTHTARKTFGMVKLNEGFTIESVSRMMGHKSIKITQSTYAQVTTLRIGSEQTQLRIK